jgi:hypothetical protein
LYGYNKISTKILNMSSPYLSSPLNYIYNKVLATGFFPPYLKYSEIKTPYKKGDINNIASYRPISLLPALLKDLKRCFIYIYIHKTIGTHK